MDAGPDPAARDPAAVASYVASVQSRTPRADAPTDPTVGGLVGRYVAAELARVSSGALSASEGDTIRRCLYIFRDWTGADAPIDTIDADRWEAWWLHLMSSDRSIEYKKKLLRIPRTFLEWCVGMGMMSPPMNLNSRRHRFGGGVKSVPTMDPATVRKLIDAAPGQLRLHLLLMANTGMLQTDISDLAPSEVDWDRGRIVRKRSKTASHDAVPTVEYELWPLTAELLRKYGHRSGDRALLTESGKPWVRDEIRPDGKRSKVDSIKSNYIHVTDRLDLTAPMKLIRKTSASLLASHPVHQRFDSHFLGHSPRSIADRHYVRPDQSLFDQALSWLGQQYGFVPTP